MLRRPAGALRDGERGGWLRDHALGTVFEEDFEVSRRAQAGLATGAVDKLVYGRNEPALQAFHRNLASQVPHAG